MFTQVTGLLVDSGRRAASRVYARACAESAPETAQQPAGTLVDSTSPEHRAVISENSVLPPDRPADGRNPLRRVSGGKWGRSSADEAIRTVKRSCLIGLG